MLGSMGMMAIGHRSSNGRLADHGWTGLIACIVAAIGVGGAGAVISLAATRL
jgi:hypothetical protein